MLEHSSRAREFLLVVAVALLVTMALPATSFAQGKIAGRVTEAGTGQALAGVNVFLDGTQQGTTTDADGNYVIVNVRPGEYTVVFSFIGFQTHRITDVRAVTGQTTRIDATLREEIIEGQEIIVRAQRPLVQKDLTASRKTVVADDIDALPVESLFDILQTQAGVTTGADGAIHIRGGRSNEVSYLVDGLSVGNPFDTNGLATSVATDAIQEMTIISGAFNAEYGKAMSGIVNLVTKEGGDKYSASATFYGGDNVTSNSDIFYTPDRLDLSSYTMEGSMSGPIPLLNSVRFFLSARYDHDDGHIYGRRQHLPSDSANFNANPIYYEIQGRPWFEYGPDDEIPSELVPMNPRQSANLLGKLTVRPIAPLKIEYSYLFDQSKRTPFAFAFRFNPDGVASIRDHSNNHSLHLTHTVSDRMFYTARMSYAWSRYSNYLYEDPRDERYVSTGRIIGFPGVNFLMGGTQNDHIYEDSRSFRARFDLTRQIGLIHEAKIGFDMQLHSLDRQNFTILYDGNRYLEPTVEPTSSPSHDRYQDQPVTELSAYVQDKLEFQDFIINAGLRFEHFNPYGMHVADLLDPQGEQAKSEPQNMLLPRLGVSFPITEYGIIHFSYGHFAQMPALRQMYVNPEFEFGLGQIPTFGNTNMRPERTVQYEVGLQQQLGTELAFDVTGFFKDIRDYLALQRLRFSTIAGEDQYNVYLNRDYANVKGITFSLSKRRAPGGLLAATLDYTYQLAEGNDNQSDAFFYNHLSGRENPLEVIPLDFDQRHVVNSTVTLSQPGNWGISLIGQFATGYPYTPLIFNQNLDIQPNSERKPSQLNLDAHLFKDFDVGLTTIRTFARIYNVLDQLNERYVFDDTGRASYSLNGERNQHAVWEARYGMPGIHTLDEYDTRPHWYSAPRRILLGVSLSL